MVARGQTYATHVITAPEAAYGTLYGHFSRLLGDGEWVNALPDRREPWNVELLQLYCETFRGGVTVHGVPVGFYYIPIPASTSLLTYGFQGITNRAQWEGKRNIAYGFGVMLRLGAVAAGDVVLVTAEYEVRP
jgi:hypothetical protein